MTQNRVTVDFDEIREHLKFLAPKDKTFAFASYTEKGRDDKSSVSARMTDTLDACKRDMQRYQNDYAALYVSVNEVTGGYTKEHITGVRALFIDLDDPTATLDDVYACPLPVHRVVETSPGKYQCYWLVKGLNVEEAEGFTRWLVRKFSADKGVWDASRVFRLPGSWHQKGEPFKVRVVHKTKTVRAYGIEEIDRAGVVWTPQAVRSKTTDYVPPHDVNVEKLVALVNGDDEGCLEIWDGERKAFNGGGLDGSRYHMAIASMIKKCRLPIEVFDVYLRAWVAKHPEGDRQGKIDRPGYVAMTWDKNTMGVALRGGESWVNWRKRREAVLGLFDEGDLSDDGQPDVDGIEEFLTGCSDDALAIRAANSFGGNLRFTPDFGTWHLWDGVKWTEDNTNRAKDAIRAFLRTEAGITDEYRNDLLDAVKGLEGDQAKDMKKLATKLKTLGNRLRKVSTLNDVRAMLTLEMRDGAEVVAAPDIWDRHDELLATTGGVINLRTGETMADGRRFFCSKVTKTDAAPVGAKPKRWLAFLKEVFNDDETIDFVHRFFGSALTGYTREECFVFAHGEGRNGKGVLTNTVADILGGYAHISDADMFTLAGAGQHKSSLAALKGVRFALSSEIPDGASWNLQRIKALTGGDPIEANFMRQNKFVFRPSLSLMICANDKPSIKHVDSSIRSRFRFLQFPNSFEGKEDRTLKSALVAEYPEIMRWLIDGAMAYLKDGLPYPAAMKTATEEYLDDADMLKMWFESVQWEDQGEQPKVEQNYFTAVDLLNHYARHCRNTATKTVGKHAFTRYLRRRGLDQHRKTFKYRYKGLVVVWGPFKDVITKR